MEISDFEQNFFGFFVKNLLLPVQKNGGGQFVFRNNFYSCHYFEHFGQKKIRLPSRICIVRLQDNRFKKKFYLGIFYHFSLTLSGKLSAFELNFPEPTVNEGLCACPKKTNKGKKREIYGFLFFFVFLSWCFLHFGQFCLGSVFKTAFYVTREKLQRNLCSKISTFWLLFGL